VLSAYVLIQAEVGKVAHVARALSGLEGVQLAEDITGPYEPRDVFATLQRVVDAAWRCSQVDGASLALEHEDGLLRWVVVTDGAAELREDTQRELGEGPGLAAYAEEATATVFDLETDRRYAGLVTVVPKLGVRGALSVRRRLAAGRSGRCRCTPRAVSVVGD
jgi:hypothetical protein